MNQIKSILLKKGPCTARELIDELKKRKKANSNATARQQISRAKEILSTNPVKFSNAYIYYLDKHLNGNYQKKNQKTSTRASTSK